MADKKKLTYKEKSGLRFVEQEEPKFIKEMKKKMGYKEPAKLEDKVRHLMICKYVYSLLMMIV